MRLNALDDSVELGLDDDAADDHLTQGGMQGLEVEDQIQLAHVLEQAVERLDEDLYQVEQGEGRLGRGADDDEVEGCVVAVGDEGGGVVVRGGGGGGFA